LFTSKWFKDRKKLREEKKAFDRRIEQNRQAEKIIRESMRSDKRVRGTRAKKVEGVPVREIPDDPGKPYLFYKPKFTWDVRVWFNPFVIYKVFIWRRWRKKALKRIIARIQLSPTDEIQLMFKLSPDNTFMWSGQKYLCNDDTAKYNLTAKMDEYYFHHAVSQSMALNVNPDTVKKAVADSGLITVTADLEPRVLESYVKSEAHKQVLEAVKPDRRIFIMVTLILFSIIIFFIVYAYQSGLLQQATG